MEPYTLNQLEGLIALNNKVFLTHLDECEECDYFYGDLCETMHQIGLARIKFLRMHDALRTKEGAA